MTLAPTLTTLDALKAGQSATVITLAPGARTGGDGVDGVAIQRRLMELGFVPGERIRYTDKFDDTKLPGEMVTTVVLRPVMCGTELSVVQENIPAAIPLEFCYLGWQESLAQLATLVEPDIPG